MTVNMIRMELLSDRLMRQGQLDRLPMREVDTGYLVHSALMGLFGDQAPKPFAIDKATGRKLVVLGYAEHDAEALHEQAKLHADPAQYATCLWEELASKPMPQAWRAGQQLKFHLRACPVVRSNKAGPHGKKNKGKVEVDAFVHACWQAGEGVPVDREQVYRDWLAAQLDRSGGARLVECKLAGFKRDRLLRRTQGSDRKAARVERPDATFEGVIEVSHGDKFMALLARGVGRHRAFGFGMMLLGPAR